MAITGHFDADFSSFQSAVKGAEVTLKGFEDNSAKVTSSLSRMTNSLSGTKLMQDAAVMVEAVARVGGTSKLTEKELQRLGVTAQEAIAKMTAMGTTAPPGLQDIANGAKAAESAHAGLLGSVKNLVIGFAAMFTARAAFNFVADVIDTASALKDLSLQTHISTDDLQIMAGGMAEFGVDADELGRAIYKLSRGIAGGDESVANGLHMMGLTLADVDGLNGKELFLKIESGLAKLQGGLRDTAAAELYGGKLGAAMAGASEGIETAIDSWSRLNHITSQESINSLDAYGEAITRAKASMSAMAGDMVGPVAQGFNTLTAAVETGASKWAIFVAMAQDTVLSTLTSGTGALTAVLDEHNQKLEAAAAAQKKATGAREGAVVVLTAQQQAVKYLNALEADAGKSLDAFQTMNLRHLKEIGALNAQNAAAIGVNAAQFNKYTADVAAATAETQKLEAAQAKRVTAEKKGLEDTQKMWAEYTKLVVEHGGTANEIAIANIDQWAAEVKRKAIDAGTYTAAFHDALTAQSGEMRRAVGIDWKLIESTSIEAQREMAANHRKTYNEMATGVKHFTREDMAEQLRVTREAEGAAYGMGRAYVKAQAEAAAAAQAHNEKLAETARKAKEAADAIRRIGGTFELAPIRVTDANRTSLQAEMMAIERGYISNPGRRAGGGGDTGLDRNDAAGWARLLAEQQRYEQLRLALGSFAGGTDGYQDFGAGTPVMLHGWEKVTPRGKDSEGGAVVVHVNVSGVFDPASARLLGDVVGRELMKRTPRKWSLSN